MTIALGKIPMYTAKEITDEVPQEPDYIVEGFAIRNALTEIAAKIKAGKTTFVSHLIKSVLHEQLFLNKYKTKRVPVIYLTEERKATFRKVLERADLTEETDLHVIHLGDTRGMSWAEVVKALDTALLAVKPGLLIVDTLSRWSRVEDENDSAEAGRIMAELEALVTKDVSVISVRHAKKSTDGDTVDAARGGSAYGGASDILLLLSRADVKGHPNRRRLQAETRFDDLPEEILIDLKMGDYHFVSTSDNEEIEEVFDKILFNLPTSPELAVPQKEINAMGLAGPTLWKQLEKWVNDGKVGYITLPGKGAPKGYWRK